MKIKLINFVKIRTMNEISIDDVSKRFEEHLAIEDNLRIIFSGKFGIGKTFFVDKFFKSKPGEYNSIVISPVNYVVSNNEDIFELIKADIIKQLFLSGKIQLTTLPEDTKLQKSSAFLEDNPFLLQKFMAKFLTKLSPTLNIPIQLLEELHKICKNYKERLSRKNPAEKTISEEIFDYASEGEEKVGSIYEHNYVTKVINIFLKEIKSPNKKNVLVIDDLDRIDPDHIFRILNILSAHNNHFDSENKFSFDHVILVCDLENIKKIYFHRYGTNIDFEGYIDKFYSTHILNFTNRDAVITYVKSIFEVNEGNKPYLDFVTLMLQNFVEQDLLSVRNLLKHKYKASFDNFILQQQSGIHEETFYMHNGIEFIQNLKNLFVDSDDFLILQFFKLMTFIFGDFNSFYDSLLELKSSKAKIKYAEGIGIVSFLAVQDHISSKLGDDLFFSKFYNEGSHRYLASVNWPECTYLGKDFRINLEWTSGNRYDGSVSYFRGAKAQDRASIQDKQAIEFELSSIFESIEKIAISCLEKDYLSQARISFKKSNA